MIGDIFDLKPQYFDLTRELLDILYHHFQLKEKQKFVVAVGGESGCGKSTTAKCLETMLMDQGIRTTIIHQDDYFRLPPHDNHANRLKDIRAVGPGEVRLDLFQEHVRAFKEGKAGVEAPLVDYPGNQILRQHFDFSDVAVLIVEGTYVLLMEEAVDCRIFMRRSYPDTVEKREERNRDQKEAIIDEILKIEQAIIRQQAALADIAIDKDYNVEFLQSPRQREGNA